MSDKLLLHRGKGERISSPYRGPNPYTRLEGKLIRDKGTEYFRPACLQVATKDFDQLIPADDLYTWKRDGCVRIRYAPSLRANELPITLSTLLRNTTAKVGQTTALKQQITPGSTPKKWTYIEYYEETKRAARSLINLGLKPYSSLALIGEPCAEAYFAYCGGIFAGGLPCGIDERFNQAKLENALSVIKPEFVFVDSYNNLQKVAKARNKLPFISCIIQVKGGFTNKQSGIYSWENFMQEGVDLPDAMLEHRMNSQAPNKCCTLVLSNTLKPTGEFKVVMLSHDNMVWMARQMARLSMIKYGFEILINYLPLCHVTSLLCNIFMPLTAAAEVNFVSESTLTKKKLMDIIRGVRPTIFIGMPHVFDHIKLAEEFTRLESSKVENVLQWLQDKWSRRLGYKSSVNIATGGSKPLGWKMANKYLDRLKEQMGFDRCKAFWSLGGVLPKRLVDYFFSIDMAVLSAYGSSNCSGFHIGEKLDDRVLGTVGDAIPGTKCEIIDKDEEEVGTLKLFGRNIFMGYMDDEELTREAFDENGWLLTQDKAKRTEGFIEMIGRKDELIELRDGTTIWPSEIEEAVMEYLPVTSCLLLGHNHPHLALLLSFRCECGERIDSVCDKLSQDVVAFCANAGSHTPINHSDIGGNKIPAVNSALEKEIQKVNNKLPRAAKGKHILSFWIVPQPFSVVTGELGIPFSIDITWKVNRHYVREKYKDEIEQMYGNIMTTTGTSEFTLKPTAGMSSSLSAKLSGYLYKE